MKNKIKKSLKIIAAAVLFLAAYVTWEVFSTVRFDKPTGDYAVGTFDTEMTDSSRTENALPGQHRYRRLLVQFWYPATNAGGFGKAKYHPYPGVFEGDLLKLLDIPKFMLSRLSRSTGNALVNAPVSTLATPYPVIIFSHGMNGSRFQNTYQMEELASHGYIVASIEHTFTASGTVFRDGSRGGVIPFERMENDSFASAMVNKWSTDQIFVIDCLEKINRDANNVFYGKLDLERLGVFGHSFGGAVSTNTLVLDKRIKAGVNLDGFYFGNNYTRGFEQPFMELRSQPASPEKVSEAELKFSHLTRERWKYIWFDEWEKRLNAYAKNGCYSYTIEGADHISFADFPLMAPFPRLLSPKTAGIHRTANRYTLAFFDEQLKGAKSDLFAERKKLLK